MASKNSTYVPSTTPGKTWKVYVHKGFDKRIYAAASEGVYEPAGDSVFESFTTEIPGDRFLRLFLTGSRLTDKVEREGIQAMIDTLKKDGLA